MAIFTIGYNDMLEALKSSMHSAFNPIAQVLKKYNEENGNNLSQCIKEVVEAAEHTYSAAPNRDTDFFSFSRYYEERNIHLQYWYCIQGEKFGAKRGLPP